MAAQEDGRPASWLRAVHLCPARVLVFPSPFRPWRASVTHSARRPSIAARAGLPEQPCDSSIRELNRPPTDKVCLAKGGMGLTKYCRFDRLS